nr:hypothetical protein CFP56_30076 [Quercus suber]
MTDILLVVHRSTPLSIERNRSRLYGNLNRPKRPPIDIIAHFPSNAGKQQNHEPLLHQPAQQQPPQHHPLPPRADPRLLPVRLPIPAAPAPRPLRPVLRAPGHAATNLRLLSARQLCEQHVVDAEGDRAAGARARRVPHHGRADGRAAGARRLQGGPAARVPAAHVGRPVAQRELGRRGARGHERRAGPARARGPPRRPVPALCRGLGRHAGAHQERARGRERDGADYGRQAESGNVAGGLVLGVPAVEAYATGGGDDSRGKEEMSVWRLR